MDRWLVDWMGRCMVDQFSCVDEWVESCTVRHVDEWWLGEGNRPIM